MSSKRRIRANELINDIRAGMNVSDLMAKYQFTSKGLRVAFQKLVDVNAMSREELSNLRSLHDVSAEGLRRFQRRPMKFPVTIFDGRDPFKRGLVTDISEKGLCVREIETQLGELKSFIIRLGAFDDSSTIVFRARCRWVKESMVSGRAQLAGFEIIDISSLDSRQLNKLISNQTGADAVLPKQRISVKAFVQDTRSGMTDSALIEKYNLSPNRLQRIFKILLDAYTMTAEELDGRCASFDDTVQDRAMPSRLLYRHVLDFVLPIYEEANPEILGMVLNITEGGVGLAGIESRTGESKNFVIPADEFFDVGRTRFQALCHWVGNEIGTGEHIGGFEITFISAGDMVDLKKLIQLIKIVNEAEAIEYEDPSVEASGGSEQPRSIVGQSDLEKGPLISEESFTIAWECPACGMSQSRVYDECPRCGVIAAKFTEPPIRVWDFWEP